MIKLEDDISLTDALDYYGINGLTAYFGLMKIGQPKEGETVLISGGAGSVGCVVGQIAKLHKCRVVGIAGTDDKCKWMRELGYDATINYKQHEGVDAMKQAMRNACPNGVDIYYDCVGGDTLNAALTLLNLKARIVLCGAMSQYNKDEVQGPSNYTYLLYRRARMEGFIFFDYAKEFPEAIKQLKKWANEGKVKGKPTQVEEGLKNYPTVINKLFEGTHRGKLIIKL